MRRIVISLVLAGLLAGTPGIATDDASNTPLPDDYLQVRDGLDASALKRLEPIGFQEVPLDVLLRHAPAVPTAGLAGNDAGCDTDTSSSGWAVTGTPGPPCEETAHDWGIRYAVHDCPSGCYSDGLNEQQGVWGLFIFSCSPGARAIFDFQTLESTNLGTGECTIVGWGPLPNSWGDWTGHGWVRGMRFSYTDNIADALVHVIA